MSEQARTELTEILAIMLGLGNISEMSATPSSFTLDAKPREGSMEGEVNRCWGSAMMYADRAFVPVWARGYFPPEALLTMRDSDRDGSFLFDISQWGMQSYQPVFFPEAHWLGPNVMVGLNSTHPGWLTIYGMSIRSSHAAGAPRIGSTNNKMGIDLINKAQAMQRAERLARGLKKLTEVMKP